MKINKVYLFLVILSCGIGFQGVAQEFPSEIKAALKNIPEDALVGIGRAKARTDGESILFAEDQAREEIARQMNTEIRMIIRDYTAADEDDPSTAVSFQEVIDEAHSDAHLTGSIIKILTKANDGAWWCLVTLSQDNISISYRIPSKEELLRYAANSNITNVRAVNSIPDWVFDFDSKKPEGWIWCVGSANVGNDEASFNLARERARRSIAHSLDSHVKSLTRHIKSYRETDTEPFESEENYLTITSEYDRLPFNAVTINIAKTRDNTWWVLLGCPVSR
ncbi:MAG: hypothetical protein LBH44_04135 [Treponema sp.]|nr:hypothetical protein [Treponema sp.]